MSRKILGGSPGPPCPPNWTRTINEERILYTTPLGHEISNLAQLRDFLLSDVTCKCNLPCPLIVDQWFDFSNGKNHDLDDSTSVNFRQEVSHKKLKSSKQPYDALLMTRLLGEVNDVFKSNDSEVYNSATRLCSSPAIPLLPACSNSIEASPAHSIIIKGIPECVSLLPSTNLSANSQQVQRQQHQSQPQQRQLLNTENDVRDTSNQQPLFVTTVEGPQLYQQPLQVYCSPTPSRPIILNNSVSVQNSMLSPRPSEIILNGATAQISAVDLNTVNNISNAQGLLSTTQIFPYPHVIDSMAPSIVLGVNMGSSVSMGIVGIDSSQLQQLPTIAALSQTQDLPMPQGGSTLVVSPYSMAPMSLESISCGVLQTPTATLEGSQGALANSPSAATVIATQTASRAANGATLLSPPVPSVCHILPISPIMNTDNATAVDSSENTLLFNVTLDENSGLLQSQECDVIE